MPCTTRCAQPHLALHLPRRLYLGKGCGTSKPRHYRVIQASNGKQNSGGHVPAIMVNSCTGKMGHAAAEAVVRAGLKLVPYTFCGYSYGVAVSNIGVSGVPVELVGAHRRQEMLDKIRERFGDFVVIDYTTPSAVNDNVAFYAANGLSFVVGTTGGDRQKMIKEVEKAGVYAIVAPQMGKQVIAFQAMISLMADHFPGCFKDYSLSVVESHQASKADVSGTARDVIQSFHFLGISPAQVSVQRVREPRSSLLLGVPEEYLEGHAFHTYKLVDPAGDVSFRFSHNVCGRSTYAEGSVAAARFVAGCVRERPQQHVFDMVDVLRSGGLM